MLDERGCLLYAEGWCAGDATACLERLLRGGVRCVGRAVSHVPREAREERVRLVGARAASTGQRAAGTREAALPDAARSWPCRARAHQATGNHTNMIISTRALPTILTPHTRTLAHSLMNPFSLQSLHTFDFHFAHPLTFSHSSFILSYSRFAHSL